MLRFVVVLCASILFLFHSPHVIAQQTPGFVVIDGKQNPPAIVTSTVNVQITDNGVGNYTLVFDQPVEFLLGTSMTEGPGFDVSDSFISTTLDSSDRRRVKVNTRYVTGTHFAVDATFSLEVRLAAPP